MKKIHAVKSAVRVGQVRASKNKISLALRNLITFAIIAIISYFLKGFTTSYLLSNFFYLLSILTTFIALTFLIVLLVLSFIKIMSR